MDSVPMATKYSTRMRWKKQVRSCLNVLIHREQCINTATDKHSTSKGRFANSIQKKVHSSYKNTDYKPLENWMVLHTWC